MESLSLCLSTPPPLLNHLKAPNSTSKSTFLSLRPLPLNMPTSNSLRTDSASTNNSASRPELPPASANHFPFSETNVSVSKFKQIFLRSPLVFLGTGLSFPRSCFASETTLPAEELPNKINLEAILVSIDDFFNRYPFFVASVTFVWLVVIPLAQEYFQKYKFISAIDAFRKLRDDPDSQLLDIRDSKSLAVFNSPNLKILNKTALQVEFREGDEDAFVKTVLENFREPQNSTVCILDNFDGKSMTAAELLVRNGMKEAYAIRGGIRGKKGWQEIQEELLPPSVHISARTKPQAPKKLDANGEVSQPGEDSIGSSINGSVVEASNGYINQSTESKYNTKSSCRSSSPYPNYPDLKPPTSPTPSKPQK